MDDNELNKWLHEGVMGLCWHPQEGIVLKYTWRQFCTKCQQFLHSARTPNYCQSFNALRAVEKKVIEQTSHEFYCQAVVEVIDFQQSKGVSGQQLYSMPEWMLLMATARQRAAACKLTRESLTPDTDEVRNGGGETI